MRDRVSQAEINAFANAAKELWRDTGIPFVTMHDAVAWVWTQGNKDIKLPPAATADYYRKIPAVRKHLISDHGCMVAPVVSDYLRKRKRTPFTEVDAADCLPSRGAPQAGFLFIDTDSDMKDLLIWKVWLEGERKVSTARGSEALESASNAQLCGLLEVLSTRPELADLGQLLRTLETGEAGETAA